MDSIDEQITQLGTEWPAWQIWAVRVVYGTPIWCARRWGDDNGRNTINRGSASELSEALEEAVTADSAEGFLS